MISKFSSIPLYVQLRDIIVEKIESGEYGEEYKIPSEQELCDMFDISRPTVRQAISELTNSGYLYKEKGKGTFVSKLGARIEIKNYSGFTDSILDSEVPGSKSITSIRTLSSNDSKIPLDSVFTNLGGTGSSGFCEIRHVTSVKNEILALHISYIPLDVFPEIEDDIRGKRPSYDIMKGKYPLVPIRSKSSVEIAFCDQADAQILMVQVGQPLFRVETVLTSKSGQVVELIISKYRSDKCKIIFEKSK